MRASRAPEGRGLSKRVLFLAVLVAAIVAGAVVTVFSMGSESISAKDAQTDESQASVPANASEASPSVSSGPTPAPEPTAAPKPTATTVPIPDPTPTPVAAPKAGDSSGSGTDPKPTPGPTLEPRAAGVPAVFPDAKFGDILEEGLVELKLHGGDLSKAWYSLQVDTKTLDITLFFAQYDDALETIISTVKVDQYAQGADLNNAEVTFFFPNGSTRILAFDSKDGSINLEQQYRLPTGPSMFSSGLRRAMVYYGMQLQDDAGEIEVQLHLDLSGLSQSEGLEFKRLVPETVDEVLSELQFLVEQIEDNRD